MVTLDQAGGARAWTRLIAPPPELESFVEFLWVQADPGANAGGGRRWRIVPDTAPHMIVKRLSGTRAATSRETRPAGVTSASIVGARTRHVDSDLPLREWTVGVRFHAGTLPWLTGVPASELTDAAASVGSACGAAGVRLEREVGEAARADDALARVLSMLLETLSTLGRPDARVDGLRRAISAAGRTDSRARATSRALAGSMGIAERTLRQRCADAVGLPPALAVRIVRLQRAIRMAIDSPRVGWARIAAATGYFDQSHLIRDFRMLLGETPRTFLARRSIDRTPPPC